MEHSDIYLARELTQPTIPINPHISVVERVLRPLISQAVRRLEVRAVQVLLLRKLRQDLVALKEDRFQSLFYKSLIIYHSIYSILFRFLNVLLTFQFKSFEY